MGLFVALTNLAAGIGYLLGGFVCDRYFARNLRIPIVITLIVSGGLIYLAAVAPNGEWAVAWLAIAFLISGIGAIAIITAPLVLVPKELVGGAIGIVNTAGQLAGIVSPLLVGYILDLTRGNFALILSGLGAICLIAVFPASRIRQTAINA